MSASLVRAAVRPFAAPAASASASASAFFLSNTARSSAAVRHIATKPTPSSMLGRAGAKSRFSNFYYNAGARRFQSGSAGSAADAAAADASWIKRLWDSPVGIKTVHFWAPMMKWALVVAGISDLARPAEKLSVMQNVALTATGLIWTRWCLIIKPKNILLAAANFFLGVAGVVQCVRIYLARGKTAEK